MPAQIEVSSGRSLARQNSDDPQVEQNPYATVGSGSYHVSVLSAVKWRVLLGALVAAM